MARLLRMRDGAVLVDSVEVADRFWPRCRGLLGRRGLDAGCGLLIVPCASIHTFGMQFAIDAAFFDRCNRVVRVMPNVPPNRMAWGGRGAHSVLELAAGTLAPGALAPGDEVTLSYS